jgi:hypothetical protein
MRARFGLLVAFVAALATCSDGGEPCTTTTHGPETPGGTGGPSECCPAGTDADCCEGDGNCCTCVAPCRAAAFADCACKLGGCADACGCDVDGGTATLPSSFDAACHLCLVHAANGACAPTCGPAS